jgi:hypothetical protein
MNIWTPIASDLLKALDDSGIRLGGRLPSQYKWNTSEVGLVIVEDAANDWGPVLYTIDAEETSGFEQVDHDTFRKNVYVVMKRQERICTEFTPEVLKYLDHSGVKWVGIGCKPSEYLPDGEGVRYLVFSRAFGLSWSSELSSTYEYLPRDRFVTEVYRRTGVFNEINSEDFTITEDGSIVSKENRSKDGLLEKFKEAGRSAAERISVANFSQPLTVGEIQVTYSQDADTWSDGSQDLKISFLPTEDGGYYVIETERWAFDSKEELIRILDDFISRSK